MEVVVEGAVEGRGGDDMELGGGKVAVTEIEFEFPRG